MKAWEKNIREVVPYVPGEQPQDMTNVIKLNTNENPYPPAPEVIEAATKINYNPLRLYPNFQAEELIEALAAEYGLTSKQIFVGVGSDDVLSMIFLTFFNSDKPILFPDITYSFYDVWAGVYRIPYEKQPLADDFTIRPEDYYKNNGGVIFPNPNAPTSLYLDTEAVEDILKHNQDVIVVVDEAYIDFGGKSALPLLDKYENLIIVRTFSKSRSLAGLRIGYAMASERLIKALNDVKYSINSYTMNYPSIKLGAIAVKNGKYYEEINKKVIATRERSIERLKKLGFICLDSYTNFIFAKHESVAGEEIFDELKRNKIFVRHFNSPRIKEYLRITIGTDEQMDAMFNILEKYLSGK